MLHPNENEKLAVQCANHVRAFINDIRKVEFKTPNSVLQTLSASYKKLSATATNILDSIEQEVRLQKETEISSYYYLYFLQQLSRFNSYFYNINQIEDQRDGLNSMNVILNPWNGIIKLKEAQINGISHPLLMQPSGLSMDVCIKKEHQSQFREV